MKYIQFLSNSLFSVISLQESDTKKLQTVRCAHAWVFLHAFLSDVQISAICFLECKMDFSLSSLLPPPLSLISSQ